MTRYLTFRDHLRTHAADRHLYEGMKRDLTSRDWPDMTAYAEATTDVIAEILQRAHEEQSP